MSFRLIPVRNHPLITGYLTVFAGIQPCRMKN